MSIFVQAPCRVFVKELGPADDMKVNIVSDVGRFFFTDLFFLL